MPKTNEQIRRDYSAMPWYKQAGVAADDLVRIGASGITGGLVDDVIGGDSAERTREAKVRAGFAGDAANVAGMVVGLKGAGKALKGTVDVARAAPTAARLASTAGPAMAARYLTGTAPAGLVPVAAAMSRGAKAGMVAKGAGLLGLLGLSMAGRQDATPAPAVVKPAAPAKPVEKALAQGREAPPVITPYDLQLAALGEMLGAPNLTIRRLERATKMLPAQGKAPSPKDAATAAALGESAKRAAALFELEKKLAGTDPQLTAKAMERDYNRWSSIAGNNPSALAQALMMSTGLPEEGE